MVGVPINMTLEIPITPYKHRQYKESSFAIRKLTGPNVNDPTRSFTVSIPHKWLHDIGYPTYVKLVRQDNGTILIEGVNS